MRCGEQCFIVTIQEDHTERQLQVNARTAIKARKKVREMYGEQTVIKTVKLERNNPL